MNHSLFNNTNAEHMQDGPISGDMNLALTALAEMIYLLPDENIGEGRKHLSSLFDCAERVEGLERVAVISPQAKEGGVYHA